MYQPINESINQDTLTFNMIPIKIC